MGPGTTGVDEHEALDRLSRVHGEAGLFAAVQALVGQFANNASALAVYEAWRTETQGMATAQGVAADVALLSPATRLPCLEALLDRVRLQPKPARRTLLQATRRVMAANAPLRPVDRLHWLLMRLKLGDRPPAMASPDAHNDLLQLPAHSLRQLAVLTAHLSSMVPGRQPELGLAWYIHVVAGLMPNAMVPACVLPDGDALANAVHEAQALPWMLRPVLVRAWVDAALHVGQRATLAAGAADALRLAAGLLESPLPPEVARHYSELAW